MAEVFQLFRPLRAFRPRRLGGSLPVLPWLLAGGTWNDTGVWDDNAAWNDGV